MIFSHESPEYLEQRPKKQNGAYWYSFEILKNIIPNIETSRNWVTINKQGNCWDHSIVFIHNNKYPELYDWLSGYKDLILVCGVPSTVHKVSHLGKAIYLPLSVDTKYVEQFKAEKDKDICFFGRQEKRMFIDLGRRVTTIEDLPREKALPEVARYNKAFAVGRCAIEAKILGCEILPYDERYPNPNVWEVIDNLDAAKMLQEKLNEIDG